MERCTDLCSALPASASACSICMVGMSLPFDENGSRSLECDQLGSLFNVLKAMVEVVQSQSGKSSPCPSVIEHVFTEPTPASALLVANTAGWFLECPFVSPLRM